MELELSSFCEIITVCPQLFWARNNNHIISKPLSNYVRQHCLLLLTLYLVGYLANWHDFEMIMIRAFRNSADNFNVEN